MGVSIAIGVGGILFKFPVIMMLTAHLLNFVALHLVIVASRPTHGYIPMGASQILMVASCTPISHDAYGCGTNQLLVALATTTVRSTMTLGQKEDIDHHQPVWALILP